MSEKNPVGRPKISVDWEQAQNCAQIGCTKKEIAAILGCSEDTLERRCAEDHGVNFAVWYEKHFSLLKRSLRRKQIEVALNDKNTQMLIWLGKNTLGQADKQEVTETSEQIIVQRKYDPEDLKEE